MTSNFDKDGWLHLRLAKSKSFKHCYDSGVLPWEMQCKYTNNETLLSTSDAVIFRGIRLKWKPPPTKRKPNQTWIFLEHEPPHIVWHTNLTLFNGLFNITATYTSDSDIPRNDFRKKCLRNYTLLQELQSRDYTQKKRTDHIVAWFVSDCKTQSKREQYAKTLHKHLELDVYGLCGPYSCGNRFTWADDNCFQKLLHFNGSYKFYLAFENSLCEEYVTEKFWQMLDLDVVPVVMGAADYANYLPKDSFLDVRDFEGPEDLANYLHYLNKNDDLYNQYIRNKNSMVCESLEEKVPWECSLCRYLHEHREESTRWCTVWTLFGAPGAV